MSTSARHVPVMRDRVIALLAPALQGAGAVLVDATLGLGGHAEHALASFPDLRLIGLDRDPTAASPALLTGSHYPGDGGSPISDKNSE